MPTSEGIREVPYDVAGSIENILLATGNMTSQRLSMVDLLRNARVAEKVKASIDKGYVLLEESEFIILKNSFDAFSGYGINEVELCKRIEKSETVEVEEKKRKGK